MSSAITECTICTENFNDHRIPAIGECNHSGICSICYLRMRTLGKDLTCPMCKTKLEHVICYYNDVKTKEDIHQFERFSIWGETCSPGDYAFDHHSAMFFPNKYYKKIEALWVKKCTQCPEANRDMKIMKTHLQTKHNLILCGLCIENKQCFPSEQKIYNQQSYDKHLRQGDKDGSEGHPNCEFCKKRYYDKLALFIHLQKDHFTCHICEKRNKKYQYFDDYKALEFHFKTNHYLCDDPHCLEQKYIVFAEEFSLVVHNRSYHPNVKQNRRAMVNFHDRQDKRNDVRDPRRHQFDAGMGGRVTRDGEWQIILDESQLSRDPRERRDEEGSDDWNSDIASGNNASRSNNRNAASFGNATNNPESSSVPFPRNYTPPVVEDFPSLPATESSTTQSSSNFTFGTSKHSRQKEPVMDDFPTLCGNSNIAGQPVNSQSTMASSIINAAGNNANGPHVDLGLWGKATKKSKKLAVYKPGKNSSSGKNYSSALQPDPSPAVALHMGLEVPNTSNVPSIPPTATNSKEDRKRYVMELAQQAAGKSPPPNPTVESNPPTATATPKAKPVKKSQSNDNMVSIVNSIASASFGAGIGSNTKTKKCGISVYKTKTVTNTNVDTSKYDYSAGNGAGSKKQSLLGAPTNLSNDDYPSLSSAGSQKLNYNKIIGPSDDKPTSKTMWKCEKCTLENGMKDYLCGACGSYRILREKTQEIPVKTVKKHEMVELIPKSNILTSTSSSTAKLPPQPPLNDDDFPSMGGSNAVVTNVKWSNNKIADKVRKKF